MCCMSVTSHPPWFHHKNDIQCHIKIIKLLTKQYFQSLVTSSLLGPYPWTPSHRVLPLMWKTKVYTHEEQDTMTWISNFESTHSVSPLIRHDLHSQQLYLQTASELKDTKLWSANYCQVLRKDSLWIVGTQAMLVCGCLNRYVNQTKIKISSFHTDVVKDLCGFWDVTLCCWTDSSKHFKI